MVCWIEGGAGIFLFSVLARRRRRATGPIAAGTWRRRPSAGWVNVQLSLRFSGSALAVFIPWRGADGFRLARGMAPALMVCWIEGGAGIFLFSVLARRRRRATGPIAAGTWRRRPSAGWVNVELSLPIFRLALAVFIPWRGADGFDRRAGWHPR